jgi:tyrosyl-tRNA synthetase
MMTLSEELQWRGQIKDRTFDDIRWLDEPKTFYWGTDCSSDSLTIGNLAGLVVARRLVKAGWKAILLVGGATSLIGDPGGKAEERALKSREEIQANVAAIKAQVERIFAGNEFTIVDNYDWFKEIGYLEFLRDVGKHFSMTELVQREFIASRMGEGGGGISYAEFSYNLIQGYDFWHLFRNNGVIMQVGGSDQWGNMLSGVPLIRKKENGEAHAMSFPLVINKATGKKFGKSEEGAVWLEATRTSIYKFYQFWLNVDDDAVEDYLKIYTDITNEELASTMQQMQEAPSGRSAQKRLAYDVTKLVHGDARAASVAKVTEVLFGNRQFSDLSPGDIAEIKTELPVVHAAPDAELAELLVSTGLASSKTEARRFLADSAVYINGHQFSSEQTTLIPHDIVNGHVLLRRGKNSQVLLDVSGGTAPGI